MKTPLIVMTTFFGISFLDGFFSWGLPVGFYTFVGIAMIVALAWMWKIELKK